MLMQLGSLTFFDMYGSFLGYFVKTSWLVLLSFIGSANIANLNYNSGAQGLYS